MTENYCPVLFRHAQQLFQGFQLAGHPSASKLPPEHGKNPTATSIQSTHQIEGAAPSRGPPCRHSFSAGPFHCELTWPTSTQDETRGSHVPGAQGNKLVKWTLWQFWLCWRGTAQVKVRNGAPKANACMGKELQCKEKEEEQICQPALPSKPFEQTYKSTSVKAKNGW